MAGTEGSEVSLAAMCPIANVLLLLRRREFRSVQCGSGEEVGGKGRRGLRWVGFGSR